MARSRRLFLGLATIALLCLPPTAAGAATPDGGAARTIRAGTPSEAAAETLAQTYVPIAMLREQQKPPCETSAEQYQPTSVETVLGNPGVTLSHDDLKTRIVVDSAPRPATSG
jgi:hypothetical protein